MHGASKGASKGKPTGGFSVHPSGGQGKGMKRASSRPKASMGGMSKKPTGGFSVR